MTVEEWLASLRSKSTRRVYLAGVRAFTNEIGVSIETYASKLKDGHDPFPDLMTFAQSLNEKPPTTANSYMLGVTSFLEYAIDYELSRKQRKQLRNRMPRGKRPRTVEDDLTREKLQNILSHCDEKGRALFLFLASSGIRVGEALQLTFDEIDLQSVPVKVTVRGEYTKTGDPYTSFISQEAHNALKEWRKVREQYLVTAAKRGIGLDKTAPKRGVKSAEDNRIFPFSMSVAHSMWNRALKKAELHRRDNGTNRRTLHIHMLRKYFNSQLKGEAKLPREIVEALMGHEEGLSVAYRRFTVDQIKGWYLKGEPYLAVSGPSGIREIRQSFDERIEKLQTTVNGLAAENLTLKRKLEDSEKWMREKAEEVFREEWRQYLIYLREEDQGSLEEFEKWKEKFKRREQQKKRIKS